jgi:hypothetical protein
MIILIVKGGLGNQLFQLSFADYLSKKYNKKLLIDDKYLLYNRISNTKRNYSLDLIFTKKHKKINIFLSLIVNIYTRIFSKFKLNLENINIIDDSFQNFDIINKNSILILSGYFQGFINQKTINTSFISSFSLVEYKTKFKNSRNKVCVHIRRGDYLKYSNIYHNQELLYFMKSINYINKYCNGHIFLFFTDDTSWVIENFKIDNITYFIASTDNDVSDFLEMSNCQNFIISNSTFSYWAANFSKNNNKIVVYPNLWYTDTVKNNLVKDKLIPLDWISF